MPTGKCAAPGALKPSYIACGPIHPTRAKAMPWIAQGNANLAYWCALLPVPVVAIAGMDPARAAQAMRCGAAGVAAIGAITAAASPEAAIGELSRAIHEAARTPQYPPPALPRSTLSEKEGPCSAPCSSPRSTASP